MSAKKLNISLQLLIYTATLFLLLLTALNLNNYFMPKKVLGLTADEDNGSEAFWQDFLSKNPNYIPGWIELKRYDKVMQIDPNFLLP